MGYKTKRVLAVSLFTLTAISFGFAWATCCDEDESYFSFVKDVVSDFFD